MMDETEAIHHEERHVVSNMLGSPGMRIEIGPAIAFAPRDTLCLASDGLTDNLFLAEIVEQVRKGPLSRAASSLVETCHRRMARPDTGRPSKPDDLSFLVFRPRP